jgi:hypothetical protein
MVTLERVGDIRIVVSDTTKIAWLSSLVDNIFKVLPTYEERGCAAMNLYLGGLLMDIAAADVIFDGYLNDVIVKLYVLYNAEPTHAEVRKRTLECTSLARKKFEALYGQQKT